MTCEAAKGNTNLAHHSKLRSNTFAGILICAIEETETAMADPNGNEGSARLDRIEEMLMTLVQAQRATWANTSVFGRPLTSSAKPTPKRAEK